MAEVAMTVGAAGVFLAGFVGWYALWRRRVASALERVPVRTDRPALVDRHRPDPPGNSR